MKLDLTPVRSTYVTPSFDQERQVVDPALQRRLRRPMLMGAAVVGVFVIGLGTWASVSPLTTGVAVPAELQVESNRKTIRHKESGTIRQILVREGQLVRAGQPLIVYDDSEARAVVAVLQSQYDQLLAQSARFQAEAMGRRAISWPPELASRMGDPQVASMVRDQEYLFTTRLQYFENQRAMLEQQIEQIQNQIGGQQAQVASVDDQQRYTEEELNGYKKLNEQGYAPKTLILRYERTLADLRGRKGSLQADISRLRQQQGEKRVQMAALLDQRQSQAADGLREAQAKLAEVGPRLTNAKETVAGAVVRAGVDGYVFELTQHTVGGVTGAGEVLMQIVPANESLVVSCLIKPQDIDQVRVGMDAQVKLMGQGARWHNAVPAKVSMVSADRITDEKTGQPFYRVELRIDPKDMKELRGVRLTPGMPVSAMIVTGKKTMMGSLISPFVDAWNHALREP